MNIGELLRREAIRKAEKHAQKNSNFRPFYL